MTELVDAVRCLVIPSDAVFGPNPPLVVTSLESGLELASAIGDLVGGWVAVVRGPLGVVICVNEEGHLRRLRENIVATKLGHDAETLSVADHIVGQVVVFGPPDGDGNETGVPDEFLDLMEGLGCCLQGR